VIYLPWYCAGTCIREVRMLIDGIECCLFPRNRIGRSVDFRFARTTREARIEPSCDWIGSTCRVDGALVRNCGLPLTSQRTQHETLEEFGFPSQTSAGLGVVYPFPKSFLRFRPFVVQFCHVHLVEMNGRRRRIDGGDVFCDDALNSAYVHWSRRVQKIIGWAQSS
jgi:hypothetical protein